MLKQKELRAFFCRHYSPCKKKGYIIKKLAVIAEKNALSSVSLKQDGNKD